MRSAKRIQEARRWAPWDPTASAPAALVPYCSKAFGPLKSPYLKQKSSTFGPFHLRFAPESASTRLENPFKVVEKRLTEAPKA